MNEIIEYHVDNGEKVTLSPEIVRKYLVNGGGNVTDQEIMMFLSLCKYQKLNPFLREVYLIKYGKGDKATATMVTGKETFLKRAQKNPRYQGHETEIKTDEEGKLYARAKVYVKGYAVPIKYDAYYEEYVALTDEYVQGKPTGRKVPNKMWKEKKRVMLAKCALVGALREAFTADLQGLYSQEEINTINMEKLSVEPVITENNTKETKKIENNTKETKKIHFLQIMQEEKTRIGEKNYYKILNDFGYKKSNEIKDRKKQEEVYLKMRAVKKDCCMNAEMCDYSSWVEGKAMCANAEGEEENCKYDYKANLKDIKYTSKQKEILKIPENFRKKAMEELEIKVDIDVLSDTECMQIIEKANILADAQPFYRGVK